MQIVWMTDPHFKHTGTIKGLNPRARLDAAIQYVNAHYADADFAVLSGDLVGEDIAADYAEIARYLSKSAIPVYPLMGNNDERTAFRQNLSLPRDAMPDFVQYVIETDAETFVFLDTHKVGSAAGEFCAARQAWLDAVLGKTPDKPAYIFLHHPPLELCLPQQDRVMMQDPDAFLDIVSAHSNVKHLFMGHVHRSTAGTVRGIPFATLSAVSFQTPAPRPEWKLENFEFANEAPQLGVINIAQGNVILQYLQFCDYDVGIEG